MILDRKSAPRIADAVEFEFNLPDINREALDNGLPLYWFNAGVQDVVEINWVFPAGIWYEQKPAVAGSVSALLKNGTSKRTAHQIHEALEFYGAVLKVNTGNDFSTVSLYTLTKHLADVLPIVFEILTDAAFPESEIQIHKQNTIQKLMVNLRECEFIANQKIDAVIFGEEHPYGRFSKKENIEAVTREDLLQFYKASFSLSNMQLFMAGNVGRKEVNMLNELFGKTVLDKGVLLANITLVNAAEARKYNIINDSNGVQGAIRIGKQFPNRLHPDFAPMVVLNTLFGGYFGSRLMSNIREEKGYTYGIYSSLSPYLNAGSFIIHTEVGKDVIEPAVKEIYHEMNLLCESLVEDEELLLVKNYLLGNLLGDLDGPFSILQRWRTLILNGMTIEHFNRNINIYKSVTPKELQDLAIKYFAPKSLYEVVVV